MFQVILVQLQNSCRQIELQIRALTYAAAELESTIAKLVFLSGMDDIIWQLKGQLSDIREDEYILRQMLQILNKVLLSYASCEKRLVDEMEKNNYSFMSRDLGLFEIPKVSDLIR